MAYPKFPPAQSSLVIDKSYSFDSSDKTIKTHIYNQVIQIVSSNQSLIDQTINLLVRESSLSYFQINNCPIYLLTEKIFINKYVNKGRVFAISIDHHSQDDGMCFVPSGHLVLSLTSHTYHRFGLIGRKSVIKGSDKYLIEIDLANEKLDENENKDETNIVKNKRYKRIYECLRRSGLKFDMIIKWEVTDESLIKNEICGMSIRNYFNHAIQHSEDDNCKNLSIGHIAPSPRLFTNSNVPIPEFITKDISTFSLEDDGKQLIEWFGAQCCQIDCHPAHDDQVSSFGYPNTSDCKTISCIQINGFFTPKDVKKFINLVIESLDVKSETNHVGITGFIVNGFEDVIISWQGKNNEHGKGSSGENLYGIAFIGKENGKIIWRISDEHDFGIERL